MEIWVRLAWALFLLALLVGRLKGAGRRTRLLWSFAAVAWICLLSVLVLIG